MAIQPPHNKIMIFSIDVKHIRGGLFTFQTQWEGVDCYLVSYL